MAKLRVRVHRDDDLRNRQIEIWKGKKKVTVKKDYSPAGDTFEMEISGRKDLLPSVPELLQIVEGTRLDRIGTIELIDLITRIALIDEITAIGTIGEITTIRDLSWNPRSLIQNPSFEEDFTGWHPVLEGATIDETKGHYSKKSLKFPDLIPSSIYQNFFVPVEVDAFTLSFFLQSAISIDPIDVIKIYYFYTDNSTSNESFKTTAIGVWEKKTCSPTAGKKLWQLGIVHLISHRTCWVDNWVTVF